jgi:IS30 family transposase
VRLLVILAGGYRYKQAHVFAKRRHDAKNKSTKLNDSIKKLIAKYLKLDWSPEQVCDSLNSRPRKCLDYKTPFEVFFNMTGIDVRKLEVVHL